MYARYDSFNRLEKPIITLCSPGAIYVNNTISGSIGIIGITSDEECVANFNSPSEFSFRAYDENNISSQYDYVTTSTDDLAHQSQNIDISDKKHGYFGDVVVSEDDVDGKQELTILSIGTDDNAQSVFSQISMKKLIFVENLGFFQITNVQKNIDDSGVYKDVTAESCEVELEAKNITYIEDKTYDFNGLLSTIIANAPLWTVKYIDKDLLSRNRYLSDISEDKNILGFLLEDMQDAFECIFVFNTTERTIWAYDINNYVEETNVFISRESLANSIKISDDNEELYTALRVSGGEDIYISPVNPTGSNVIYDFSHFTESMGATLGAKVTTWDGLVKEHAKKPSIFTTSTERPSLSPVEGDVAFETDTYNTYLYSGGSWSLTTDSYYGCNLVYYEYLESKSNIESAITMINTRLDTYKRCKENIVAESGLPTGSIGYYIDGDNVTQLTNMINNYSAYIVSYGGETIPIKKSYIDSLSITDDEATTTYVAVGDPGSEIIGLYIKDDTGLYIQELTQSDTVSDTTFTYDADPSSRTLTFKSGLFDDGTEIAVFYKREVAGSEEDNIVLIKDLLETVNAFSALADAELLIKQNELTALTADISEVKTKIDGIVNTLKITAYFTVAEQSILASYIFEGSYQDEYVTITDQMNYEDRFKQMSLMYDRALSQLGMMSEPNQEYSVDVESFIFSNKYLNITSALSVGTVLTVEEESNSHQQLFLTSFTVNYDDGNLTLNLGNKYNKTNTKALFDKTLGNISRTSNSVSYIKDIIYPIKPGNDLDKMKDTLAQSRNISAGNVFASSDNYIVIDENGYTGRRAGKGGDFDPEQIKIINNSICLTDDAWESCKLAIGKLVLDDNTTAYGVNAEIIIGELIMGNQLKILGDDGKGNIIDIFEIMDNKISAYVERIDFQIHSVTTTTGFTFDENGLTISQSANAGIKNTVDSSGMKVKAVYVSEGVTYEEVLLSATNDGVNARNLTATTFLVIGEHSRFESYSDTDIYGNVDTARTACFFV